MGLNIGVWPKQMPVGFASVHKKLFWMQNQYFLYTDTRNAVQQIL
jgi:NAD/NADP transhydrogenase beta subunit